MKPNASVKSRNWKARRSLPADIVHRGGEVSRRAASASVSGVGRGMAGSLRRRRRGHDRGALDLVVPDLRHVEGLEVVLELLECLLERGQRLARAGERRRAREDIVLDVRVSDSALLDLRDHEGERLVRLANEIGALLALREGLGEAAAEELVDPA